MKTCNMCGRSVPDEDGMELKDGRFFCKSGGCQTRFLNGVFETSVKPDLLRQGGVVLRSGPAESVIPILPVASIHKRRAKKWWQFWK